MGFSVGYCGKYKAVAVCNNYAISPGRAPPIGGCNILRGKLPGLAVYIKADCIRFNSCLVYTCGALYAFLYLAGFPVN